MNHKVIVLIVLCHVLFLGLALIFATDKHPDSAVPEASVISTAGWKHFRHDVYPWEIIYPPAGRVTTFNLGFTNSDQRTDVLVRMDPQAGGMVIESDLRLTDYSVTDDLDLKQYVTKAKDEIYAVANSESIAVAKVVGDNWEGYQYSDENAVNPSTWLYILHNDKIYRIVYSNTDAEEMEVVKSFRFYR